MLHILNQQQSLLSNLLRSLLALAVFCSQVAYAESLLEKADSAYARREVKNSRQIDLAISLYQSALVQEPKNFELHFKLIEALYFKGYHVSKNQKQKEKIFAEVLQLSENTIDLLSDLSKVNLRDLNPKEQAAEVKNIKAAAPTFFWNSISWGLWGMTFGNFASARKSVATKVRDTAIVLMRIDSNYADGGGYRLLGRLHTVAPKIPFFTFWIDREYGIKLLRKANQVSTTDPRNQLFLAEALLKYEPEKKSEAIELLKIVSQRKPLESYYVEQLETINAAKNKLQEVQ